MILTLDQLKAIKAEPVSYRCKFGGIGFGYRLPSSLWKPGQELTNVIWVNRGNGHHPEEVEKIWPGDQVYLNAVRGIRPN